GCAEVREGLIGSRFPVVNACDISNLAARNVCISTVLGVDDNVDQAGCRGGSGERCGSVSEGEEAAADVFPGGPEKLHIKILLGKDRVTYRTWQPETSVLARSLVLTFNHRKPGSYQSFSNFSTPTSEHLGVGNYD